ncbi:hypothetical protein G7054_g9825 [Neopestalotiopsis clavispora]|nr:hypothetical protein G7054_g9825 [Neopestalotiopsis clavispora]
MGKSKRSGLAAQQARQLAAPAQYEYKSPESKVAGSSSSSSSSPRYSDFSTTAQQQTSLAASSSSSSRRQGSAAVGRTANDVVPKRFAMPRSKSPPLHNHHIQTPWENVRPPREGYPEWYETFSEVQWYLSLPDQFPAVRKPKGHH